MCWNAGAEAIPIAKSPNRLGITANTVKKHVDHILQKLQVSTRAAAVAVAMRAERN